MPGTTRTNLHLKRGRSRTRQSAAPTTRISNLDAGSEHNQVQNKHKSFHLINDFNAQLQSFGIMPLTNNEGGARQLHARRLTKASETIVFPHTRRAEDLFGPIVCERHNPTVVRFTFHTLPRIFLPLCRRICEKPRKAGDLPSERKGFPSASRDLWSSARDLRSSARYLRSSARDLRS
jgi:hypothetical protein